MSLEHKHIRSSSRHYAPFLCTICTNLPDPKNAFVTTTCSHCFCYTCIEIWLLRSFHCPVCNMNLSYVNVKAGTSTSSGTSSGSGSGNTNISINNNNNNMTMMIGNNLIYIQHLSKAQPLAYRILTRIKVSCPLKQKHGCLWEGDYGDLQSHLLSSSAHLNFNDVDNNDGDIGDIGDIGGGNVNLDVNMNGNHDDGGNGNMNVNGKNNNQGGNVNGNVGGNDHGNDDVFMMERIPTTTQTQINTQTTTSILNHDSSHSKSESENDSDSGSDSDSECSTRIDVTKYAKVSHHHHNDSNNNDNVNNVNININIKRLQCLKRISLAESFKIEANAKFSIQSYVESRALYNKALSVLILDDTNINDNDNVNVKANVKAKAKTNDDSTDANNNNNNNERKMGAILNANIAATYIMTREYTKCIQSCNGAIQLDKSYIKAYMRKSKAFIALGQFEKSLVMLQDLKTFLDGGSGGGVVGGGNNGVVGGGTSELEQRQIESEYSKVKQLHDLFSHGENQLQNKQYIKAKTTFGSLLKHSNASNIVLNAARADLGLGLTDSALRLSLQVVRNDPTCSEGYEVRGQTMHLMGEYDTSIQLLKEGLRYNPDCKRIKIMIKIHRDVYQNIKNARSSIYHRRFEDGVEFFTKAFDIQSDFFLPSKAPLYSKLLTERGECYLRLKQYHNALKDTSKAVYSLSDCIPAWIIMANALHGLGRHEDALTQMEDLMRKWGSSNDQIRSAYEKADFEVRKMKRPNFYKLFGVSPIVSEMELKKAYKIKAKEMHPDRFSGSKYTEKERKEAKKNFQLLGQGLETLCDDFKRQLYDEGYDPDAIRERVAAAQQAAHRQGGGAGRQYHHNH